MSFWRNAEEELKIKRYNAWKNIVNNNRKRKIYVDPNIDLSRLADEVNDMELEFNR